MTLIVGMKANKAIILAADSRGTVGDPRGLTAINDSYEKLFQVGSCGLGAAGASEIGAALLDELRQKNIGNITNINSAIQQVVHESAECFARWFREIPPAQRPGVLLTLAGYRFPTGQQPEPMIYLLNSQANFAPQLFGNMPCLSGVPQYAVYLVHRYYDTAISVEKAKALAEYLIAETASQDPKVGGPIHMAEITPDNGYRKLTQEEVAVIHQSNEELNQRLREFFLTGGTQ
jgi:20S proteasome alpha/beta subunit